MGKRRKRRRPKDTAQVPNSYKSPRITPANYDPDEEEQLPIMFSGYTITYEPINDYSAKIRKRVTAVYDLLHSDPRQAIKQLEKLMERYPQIPVFGNYLAVAYEQIGDYEKSEYWLEENYRRHPDYLISRVNMGEKYLREKRLDKVEEVLAGKFDLKLLYPDRDVFHVTEAIAFFGLAGKYFWFKGQKQQARVCYELLAKIQPDCPSALFLQSVLHPFRYWLSPRSLVKFLWLLVEIALFPLLLLFFAISKLIKLLKRILAIG